MSVRPYGTQRRRHVVVVAFAVIPGDDDSAVRPVRTFCDLINTFGDKGLADLRVGIAGVVIVSEEAPGASQLRIGRLQAHDVSFSPFNRDNATGWRQAMETKVCKKRLQVVQVCRQRWVIADVAEVLRPVMMGDIRDV